MALTFELQADSVVDEAFAIESLGEAERAKQAHRAVLENAGTQASLDVGAIATLEDDGFDPVTVQDVRER